MLTGAAMDEERRNSLKQIAIKLVENNKGILAIDESPKSMENKFASVGIDNTPENRRRYREMLLTGPSKIGEYLGGVILNEETFFQKDAKGVSFVEHMKKAGICVGVKLDKGLLPLNQSTEKEKMSTGLDDLKERCSRYKEGGASFAKWRSVFSISNGLPTDECINKNCEILSEYALICQNNGLVPVVEPEVLFDGSYDASQCEVVTASVISCLFYHINKKGLYIPGIILKTGFVTSGPNGKAQSLSEVAEGTLTAFMSSVPPSIPGVVFLSGGHPEDISVKYLKEANAIKRTCNAPWSISYSFGRALQDSVLELWGNKDENKEKAQKLLEERARICSEAVKG
ncbi:fructose-bisphosphate aldolase, class I [Nematocida minor]|uniref:fructose-bisphosphate aldolase, class I n=1 Tax=Nematocida minor TaxID=1912983 RepID=UPI00221E3BEB|nr:fructose-bisphosphate aldolase, class I [Nematocida minor]KAI5190850.1 fructose-bisphosphate aldolase, class I [Nematocida minor]